MNKTFEHAQFAHCESGVMSTLLTSYGLKISEPMAFGLTSSLAFVYIPIVKMNNMPLIAYRDLPKNIINRASKVLGIKMAKQSFKTPKEANDALTQKVNEGKLVGLQTSVFYLPYFPKDMRFHFNAHNLLVYGKKENQYMISDPVFEEPVLCDENELNKARFAKGVFAPKGFMYYPESIPTDIDLGSVIKKAIKKNARSMLAPVPFAGVKGMRMLARKIASFEKKRPDDRYLKGYLTHIVRMQEEIGTGGGGFRFLYAAFLKEALEYDLDKEVLTEASELFVQSGNALREFALSCVGSAKDLSKFDAAKITAKLIEASEYEERAFRLLKSMK